VAASAMTADLVGYDASVARRVHVRGTGTLLYGLKIGWRRRSPAHARRHGGRCGDSASQQSHYSCLNAAAWLGIGQDNVISVPSRLDNSIEWPRGSERAAGARGGQKSPASWSRGLDRRIRDRRLHRSWPLRDRLVVEFELSYSPRCTPTPSSVGPGACLTTIDFPQNPLGFRGRTVRALAAARTTFASRPGDSSASTFSTRPGSHPMFRRCSWCVTGRFRADHADPRTMPLIFINRASCTPGMFTLETTRSGQGPMRRSRPACCWARGLPHAAGARVEMAEVLRERIESHPP